MDALEKIAAALGAGFISKIRVTEGCWEWIGQRYVNGYGMFQTGSGKSRKNERAHRAVWRALHDSVPTGVLILHRRAADRTISFLGLRTTT